MLNVGIILDEFSEACFWPEFNCTILTPDNFIQFSEGAFDFIFVESIWTGHKNCWKGKFVDKYGNPSDLIKKVINKFKGKIPTVFWQKEGAAHFNRYIQVAKLFDYVCTTDSLCVDTYKKALQHSNVFVLPFAAQPMIHKYSSLASRKNSVCFSGTYRGKQYKQRTRDMEYMFMVASKYKLEIYDRKANINKNSFPKEYRQFVKGGVPYEKMCKKYSQYRVFLNVNSISNSPTMFSRRVFELLACGTPVISSSSIGIKEMLPEVLLVNNGKATNRCLKNLMINDAYWKKISDRGRNRVLSEHTYMHRVKTICETLGI